MPIKEPTKYKAVAVVIFDAEDHEQGTYLFPFDNLYPESYVSIENHMAEEPDLTATYAIVVPTGTVQLRVDLTSRTATRYRHARQLPGIAPVDSGAASGFIVRRLAGETPWHGGAKATCMLCGIGGVDMDQLDLNDLAVHDPACAWRLAREWTALHQDS